MKHLLRLSAVIILAAHLSVAGQGDLISPGDSLLADGIPKVPASLALKVNRYTNAYGFRLAGWDPARREVLLKNLAASETWILQATAGGSPRLLTLIPTGAYDLYYQPQAKYLVYNRDADGNDSFQLYLYDIAAHKSTLITDGKSRNTEPVWSHSGDRLIYSSSPPGGKGVGLSVISPFDPESTRLVAEGRGNYLKAYDWSPDDRKAVFCDFASNTVSALWIIDVTTGERTLLSPKREKEEEYYDGPQFSKDGGGIYVITDRDSEFRRLAYLDLSAKRYEYLSTHIRWDVEDFKLSPDGKALAFITNEDGVSRLHLLDTKTGKERQAPPLQAGIISDIKWHNNSVELAFNLRSSRTPNDVYSLDINTGKIEQWYRGVTGGADLEKLPEPERISWRSFDGRMISGFLYRPPSTFTGKRPVVINIHGGPEEQYRPEFGYSNNYFTNELGVAMIFPNVRGSSGYGKSFHRLDDGTLRVNASKDIGALLDWIKSRPDLDADRVMVEGASYGGYLALSVATSYGERIRAVVSDSGMSDLVTFNENTAGWRRDLQRQEFGDERDPKTREFLGRAAPLNNASKIKKPLLLIQGKNDPRVPFTQARQMVEAVKKNGTQVWYLLAKDEGHDWSKKGNRDFRSYVIALFVQEYLLKQTP
jgi:dipeptidyl aminopeptidase/acylaminoacyl peptidase